MIPTRRISQSIVTVAAVVAMALVVLAGPSVRPAAAADVCTRWAAAGGNDANDGSQARPVATIRRLAIVLAPGETGCLKAGTTIPTAGGWGILTEGGRQGAPMTIRSEPGGRATILGQIHIQPGVTDVVLRDLDIVGPRTLSQGSTLVIVDGNRTSLIGNDVTHPRGVCIDVGDIDGWEDADATPPTYDFVLDRNRVHDCGMDPTNVFSQADSGAHGIYLAHTRNARVTNNLVYRNRWRGLQTWPKAEGSLIANNVFDQNSTHVNVGSSLTEDGPWYSSDTVVRDNIMTNRVTDYRPEKNPANIYGNFPTGSPTYGNQAFGNCIDNWGGAPTGGNGIAFGANLSGNAIYVDRAAGDFRLAAGSPCAGKGPTNLQDGDEPVGPALAVSVSSPASRPTGGTAVATVTVANGSAVAVSDATLSYQRRGDVSVAATSVTGAQCDAGSCRLPVIPAGGRVRMTFALALSSPGQLSLTASVADATGSDTTAVSGPTCTVAGGFGNDLLTGTDGDDVLCGFAGADVLRPGAGNDVLLGGASRDMVSYLDAAGPAVVNLGQRSAWDDGSNAVGWDTFTSIEAAEGSAFADTLAGRGGADILRGAGGADQLLGYGGDDRLAGGAGDDALNGGDGVDTCRQNTGAGALTGCEQ